MRKLILLTISWIVFLSTPVYPAQAFRNDITPTEPTNTQGLPSDFVDLFFPGLDWFQVDTAITVEFVTDGNSTTINTQGTAYRSSAFHGKPSSELFAFYYLNRMRSLGWHYVSFLDNDFLMEIQYYHPEMERGLDVRIGRCALLSEANAPIDHFCVQVWVSSSPITPTPKTQTLSEVQSSSQLNAAEYGSRYQNPLTVPFYSQRALDPNGQIFVGYGNCSFTLYDVGCTVAAYAMIYSYYQPSFTDPVRLNETLKVAPGVFRLYQSGCYIYWPDYLDLPDAPRGVWGSPRVYNACQTPNCLDSANIALIDQELRLGHPVHARVHWAGEDENHHSVVIIGYKGDDFFIRDPLALDSSPRTLSTGVEGEYIVDYLIPTHGSPPLKGSSFSFPSDRTKEILPFFEKYSPNRIFYLK